MKKKSDKKEILDKLENIKDAISELKPNAAEELQKRQIELLKHEQMIKLQEKHHKEMLKEQRVQHTKSTKWIILMVIITFASLIAASVITSLTAWETKKSVDAQIELYSPKIAVQLIDKYIPWGQWSPVYEHEVWKMYWNDTSYQLPLYIEINNVGIVPAQLYNIYFQTECGLGNRGYLTELNKLDMNLGEAETIKFTESIRLDFENGTVSDHLPCEVDFLIMGRGIGVIKKIILVKDE